MAKGVFKKPRRNRIWEGEAPAEPRPRIRTQLGGSLALRYQTRSKSVFKKLSAFSHQLSARGPQPVRFRTGTECNLFRGSASVTSTPIPTDNL